MNDRGSTCKFRNARSAFRNLHVDPLSFIKSPVNEGKNLITYPAHRGFYDKSEISRKYQHPIGYEWTQNASFASGFHKKKNEEEPPPPPMRKEKKSPASRISENGALKAKITCKILWVGGGIQQAIGKNGLRMHPFFQKFSRGDPPPPRQPGDKKTPLFGFI